MRPRGDCRRAIGSAAHALGRGTWRDLATAASVGFDVARRTAENMVRDGQLVRAGTVSAPGASRPMTVYAPAAQPDGGCDGAALVAVVRCWADFR